MTAREKLLADCEAFLERSGMKPYRLGKEALNDAGFMARLRAGSDVTLGTAETIRRFMAEYRPPNPTRAARAARVRASEAAA